MTRKMLSSLIGAIGLLGMAAACSGQTSIGAHQNKQRMVDPADVVVGTEPCPAGYVHPNVCCTSSDADGDAACAVWIDEPLRACEQGWTTFPDGEACCSLDDGDCLDCTVTGECPPPPPPDPNLPPPDPSTCEDLCPPGYVGDGPSSPGGCCEVAPDGQILGCYGGGSPGTEPMEPCPPGYIGESPSAPGGCCEVGPNGEILGCYGSSSTGTTEPTEPTEPCPPGYVGESPSSPGGCCEVAPDGQILGCFGTGSSEVPDPIVVCPEPCPEGWTWSESDRACCTISPDGDYLCFATVSGGDAPDASGSSGGGSTEPPPPDADAGAG